MAITITKGQTFATRESITNTKLHNLVDLADWTITDQAVGDICYFDGTNWLRLAKGTAGQVLTMNATATAPEWKTPQEEYVYKNWRQSSGVRREQGNQGDEQRNKTR